MTVETDTPTQEDDERYLVSLTFRFDNATGPIDAVNRLIENLVGRGLRDWTYRVDATVSGDTFFVDGYGDVRTEDELYEDIEAEEVRLTAEQAELEAEEVPTEGTEPTAESA